MQSICRDGLQSAHFQCILTVPSSRKLGPAALRVSQVVSLILLKHNYCGESIAIYHVCSCTDSNKDCEAAIKVSRSENVVPLLYEPFPQCQHGGDGSKAATLR